MTRNIAQTWFLTVPDTQEYIVSVNRYIEDDVKNLHIRFGRLKKIKRCMKSSQLVTGNETIWKRSLLISDTQY